MLAWVAGGLIGLFVLSAILNAQGLPTYLWSRRSSSMIPFGGFLGAIGFWLTPRLMPYAWAPLILDASTFPVVLGLCMVLHEVWTTSRFNLISQYSGKQGIREIDLRLFRNGIFTISQRWSRPAGELGILQSTQIGEWVTDGDRIQLRLGDRGAWLELNRTQTSVTICELVGSIVRDVESDCSLDGLILEESIKK